MNSGHRARKRFGQNFLIDEDIIDRILDAVSPRSGDHLVEIGPGQGALTRPLLDSGARLDVIEIDRDLVAGLERLRRDHTGLTIHGADALKFDLAALVEGGRRLRVVGNLPYNISTPLLFHLLDQGDAILDMHLMLQKEVVDRMVAAPGNKTYGRLGVMVQMRCEVERLFDIGPWAFRPPPQIQSTFVRVTPRASPLYAVRWDLFEALVKRAFAQRRKTLRNALKGLAENADFARAGIDPGARGEQLGLAEFARLCEAMDHGPR